MQVMEMHSSKPALDFEWCFKPYLTVLKLLTGAPVDRFTATQKSKGFFPYCLAFYGAILLLIMNAGINVFFVYGYININFVQQVNHKMKTQSDIISMSIDVGNEVFMVFESHLCFFLIRYVRSPSKRLWDCLFDIEKYFQLPTQCYHRVRKIVFLRSRPSILGIA